jgi:hypothetical protein
MCGRFTYKLTWEELVRLYRLTLDQPALPSRNSPTTALWEVSSFQRILLASSNIPGVSWPWGTSEPASSIC